jgi:hypothetical protein
MSSKADLAGIIGSSCNIGSDCLYGECTNNVCSAPLLKCPSANGKSQCDSYFSALLFSSLLYLLYRSFLFLLSSFHLTSSCHRLTLLG